MSLDEIQSARDAKLSAYHAVLRKLESGAKPTAADMDLIREVEREQALDFAPESGADLMDLTLDQAIREWILCAGVVVGREMTIGELARAFDKQPHVVSRKIVREQLGLLDSYGFLVDLKASEVTGHQRQQLELVTSLEQVRRATADIECQRYFLRKKLRASGEGLNLLKELADIQLKLARQRDVLVLKIQQEDRASRKAAGAETRAINIEINDGPLDEED